MRDRAPTYIPVMFDENKAPVGQATRWSHRKVTIEITDPDVIEQLMQIERPVLTLSARHLPRYSERE